MKVYWDWLVILALCWLGLLIRVVRLRHKRDNHAARWICVALAALVTSMVLQVAVVHASVDALTAAGTAALASNCLTVLALASAVCVFLYLEQSPTVAAPRVKRWTAVGLAVSAVMIVLSLSTQSNYPEYLARMYTTSPVPPVSWHGYVYVAYVGPAAAVLGRVAIRYARLAEGFSLHLGLRLMGAGTTIAAAYALTRLAGMIAYDIGVARSVLYGPVVGLMFRMAIMLVLSGLVLPMIGPRLGVDRIMRWVALNRQYRLLFPLWKALRTEFPAISLHPLPRYLPFAASDAVLYRRMIEIWDGLLCLRPYADGALDAATVHRALRRKRSGEGPHDSPASIAATGDEVAELTELARRFRDTARV